MASVLRDALPFFGVSAAGATDRMIQLGRQRSAALAAFLAFVLIAAGQADEAWVSGGFEIQDFTALPPAKADLANSLCSGCLDSARPLGDTFTRRFNLGLHLMSVSGSYYFNYSQVTSWRTCNYPLADFVGDLNAAAASGEDRASKLVPLNWVTFQGAQGLLVFASVLMGVAWLGIAAVMYEAPFITTWKWTALALRLTSLVASFFALTGILVFGTSPIKSDFCSIFDPDGDFLNLPCYYGDGFNCACAAVFFTLVSSAILWFGVNPNFTSGTVYEFGSKAGGYSAPLGSSGGDAGGDAAPAFSGSFQGGASSTGSAYQGFGSAEL